MSMIENVSTVVGLYSGVQQEYGVYAFHMGSSLSLLGSTFINTNLMLGNKVYVASGIPRCATKTRHEGMKFSLPDGTPARFVCSKFPAAIHSLVERGIVPSVWGLNVLDEDFSTVTPVTEFLRGGVTDFHYISQVRLGEGMKKDLTIYVTENN